MAYILLLIAAMIFAVRATTVRRLWGLPMKNGEDRFLGQHVGPGFYHEAGATLLKRYRVSLIVPLLLDAPLTVWLIATQRYDFLFAAQFIAMLASIVVHNVVIAHFSYRAQLIAGVVQERPATMQLSMSPRRLRDHTNPAVELLILAATLLSLGLLARAWAHSNAGGGDDHAGDLIRGGIIAATWISYMQLGLLLLKIVFVRWRMPLPANRAEDFRQWRSAWLSYHLQVFDSSRLFFALVLLSGMWIKLTWKSWTRDSVIAACVVWIPALVAYFTYVIRARRRLAAAERELRPIEMVKEFPRLGIPQGRFLAGGLLYFNRDNPVVLVRSAQGIAINLAHPGAYVWAGYFIGLALLTLLTMGI